MADEPVTLEFLARQQQRVIEEIGVMRDDMQVLTAMIMRLDGPVGLALTHAYPESAPGPIGCEGGAGLTGPIYRAGQNRPTDIVISSIY